MKPVQLLLSVEDDELKPVDGRTAVDHKMNAVNFTVFH